MSCYPYAMHNDECWDRERMLRAVASRIATDLHALELSNIAILLENAILSGEPIVPAMRRTESEIYSVAGVHPWRHELVSVARRSDFMLLKAEY